MLKYLLYIPLFFLLVSCAGGAQHQEYTIVGTLPNTDTDGSKVVLYATTNEFVQMPLDSTFVRDGSFVFSGVAPLEPSGVSLGVVVSLDGLITVLERNFVLEAGEMKFDIDSTGIITVTGTPINDMSYVCSRSMRLYQDSCKALLDSDLSPDARRRRLAEMCSLRNDKMLRALLPNINTGVTQKIIAEHYQLFSETELDMMYRAIGDKHKEEAHKFRSASKGSFVGQTLGDTFIPDTKGDTIKLQDIFRQHDYTLVDFWASWCGPCMRNMVDLKRIYSRYAGPRFEVVGVSLDDDKDKWLRAIDNVDGGWVDVSYLSGWNCQLSSRLMIDFVPATILFDRNGKILLRNPSYAELEIILAQ